MVTSKASEAYMNKKKRIFFALATVGALFAVSCNSSSDYDLEPVDYSGVALKGFSLKADKTVLNNLDSVFFSIDLNSAEVFNADSLPMGTDVSQIGITLTYDACSEAMLYESPGADGSENKVDYLEDSESKVNFANGPVRLHLVSADGTNSRDYYIHVNVHKVKADSLCWGEIAQTALPTSFTSPKAQKTVKSGDKAYCLSTDGSSFCIAVSDNPFDKVWSKNNVTFPAAVDVRSFTATPQSFFILGEDGSLFSSTDAMTWSDTGRRWASITAVYGNTLLGLKLDNGRYYHTSYPANGADSEASADFPVGGNSNVVDFMSKWSQSLQIMTSGGHKADGSLSGDTWAFDGNSWVKLSSGLPAADGYAVVPYIISETDTVSWRVKESDVMLAFGGKGSEKISRTVYLSRDYGVTWSKADQLLQLPEEMPAVYNADALVFKTMLDPSKSAASIKGWRSVKLAPLPVWFRSGECASRAIAPITEWECPYIYMFGGVGENGALVPQVWRGVVNHLAFKPLQ